MALRVAINGFGRIGRSFLRSVLSHQQAAKMIDIVAINEGPAPSQHLDLMFKHDSVMGAFPGDVYADSTTLTVGSSKIKRYAQSNPKDLPWSELAIDWVVEASGQFRLREQAAQHCIAGAKKVLISAPSNDADCTVIPGVFDAGYDQAMHEVISLGSCTTNCLAAVLQPLVDNLVIEHCMMTTIHAYTTTQALLDTGGSDPRRARAAGLNMIPTSTGARKLITQIFPQLEGKIDAMAVRVPVPNVSMVDLTIVTQEPSSSQAINQLFKNAATTTLQGTLAYTEQPLVSSDYSGNQYAAVVDGLLTKSTGKMHKVCAWYDNEFGYASRIRDFLLHNA